MHLLSLYGFLSNEVASVQCQMILVPFAITFVIGFFVVSLLICLREVSLPSSYVTSYVYVIMPSAPSVVIFVLPYSSELSSTVLTSWEIGSVTVSVFVSIFGLSDSAVSVTGILSLEGLSELLLLFVLVMIPITAKAAATRSKIDEIRSSRLVDLFIFCSIYYIFIIAYFLYYCNNMF